MFREFDSLEMYDDGNDVVVKIAVLDIGKDEIKVSIKNNMLQIKGKREIAKEVKGKGYYAREEKSGSFLNEFSLLTDVNAKKLKKEYKNGRLIIRIPKK